MPSLTFTPVYGTIIHVSAFVNTCCQHMVSVRTGQGTVNFLVSPATYVVDQVLLKPGMPIFAFYESNAPESLIFPPQYQAVAIGRRLDNERITMGFFDASLTQSDGSLKLNISRNTLIQTLNGQVYSCEPSEQFLIVFYHSVTRSIPPQTTPHRIIAWC